MDYRPNIQIKNQASIRDYDDSQFLYEIINNKINIIIKNHPYEIYKVNKIMVSYSKTLYLFSDNIEIYMICFNFRERDNMSGIIEGKTRRNKIDFNILPNELKSIRRKQKIKNILEDKI